MKKILFPPKEELEFLYYTRKMNKKQIAHIYDCCPETSAKWFKFYGIESRDQSDICKRYIPNKEEILCLYFDKEYSTNDLSEHFKVSKGTIYNWMKKYEIICRTLSKSVSIAITGVLHSKEWNENISKGHTGKVKIHNQGRNNAVFKYHDHSLIRKTKYAPKSGTRKDIGIFVRSAWEANMCRYLNFLKNNGDILHWEYEPKTFLFENPLPGIHSYTPDFRVFKNDNTYYWIEVKGVMDKQSKEKLDLFKKYYSQEILHIFDKNWFKENERIYGNIIPHWEKRIRIKNDKHA